MELCCLAARAAPWAPRRRRAAGGGARCAVTAPAPMGEKTEYRDGPLERAFMGLFARKMEKYASAPPGKKPAASGGKAKERKRAVWEWDYESFVDVSRRVMVGRTRAQQQEAVREVLLSMLPPGAPDQFRKLFPPTRWACEFNAALTVPFFHWLVGPSEVIEVEVDGVKQKSGVLIKKCRYLENSGCVGMCVNMCKIPTQNFFTNEFGLPLTMNPTPQQGIPVAATCRSNASMPRWGKATRRRSRRPTTQGPRGGAEGEAGAGRHHAAAAAQVPATAAPQHRAATPPPAYRCPSWRRAGEGPCNEGRHSRRRADPRRTRSGRGPLDPGRRGRKKGPAVATEMRRAQEAATARGGAATEGLLRRRRGRLESPCESPHGPLGVQDRLHVGQF